MDAIVERLRQVGFSLYEARLYAALLRYGPQNGNELSRNSGVPSSKVYATVEKLVAEGSVQRIASASWRGCGRTSPRLRCEVFASSGCSTRRRPTSRPGRGCGIPTKRSWATGSAAGC